MNNSLWEFAVTIYAREGVANACLRAQDQAGCDVNLLLYAAWLAGQHCELVDGHLRELDATLLPWRSRVIEPLRQLRRDWKGIEDAQALRESVKQMELLAEQREIELIWNGRDTVAAVPGEKQLLHLNLTRVLALTCSDSEQLESLANQLDVAFRG
jgi:uncharacterized protein (TIGR02444 family)